MGFKALWKRFIENLEKENRRQFSGKRLDCCNLNDDNPSQKTQSQNSKK